MVETSEPQSSCPPSKEVTLKLEQGDNWRGTVLKEGGLWYLSQFVSRSIDNCPRIPLFTGMPVEVFLAHLRALTAQKLDSAAT